MSVPVPIPDHLVLLVVLDKKPISGHVVAVDDDAGVGSVAGPTHTITVIRAPRPNIIKDYVVAVDHQTVCRATRRRTANPEEHIVKR